MLPFRDISTNGQDGGSPLLDRIVAAVAASFRSLERAVLNDRLVRVTFAAATTDVKVTHGLGAPPRTWEVVDIDADANVWRSGTTNTRPSETIILQASAPVTVVLRFS